MHTTHACTHMDRLAYTVTHSEIRDHTYNHTHALTPSVYTWDSLSQLWLCYSSLIMLSLYETLQD